MIKEFFVIVAAMAATSAIDAFTGATTPRHEVEPTLQGNFFASSEAPQVFCRSKEGRSAGSGVVVGPDRVLTAEHVVIGSQYCVIGDELAQARVLEADTDHDWAVLEASTQARAASPISCDGFQTGAPYFVVGYWQGMDLAEQALRATAHVTRVEASRDYPFPTVGVRVLDGLAVEGMSGGPVIDGRGRLTGIIVDAWKGRAGAIDLRDTPLCRKGASPAT
jgi:S1-C subfamily serine protease